MTNTGSGGVGGRLREARERQGLSLPQIAVVTKISPAVLAALERNDLTRVPGGVFARGFVRSFADAVGLDRETIVAEFVAQSPGGSVTAGYAPSEKPSEVTLPDLPPPPRSKPERRPASRRRLAVFGALSVSLCAIFAAAAIGWPIGRRVAATKGPAVDVAIPPAQSVRNDPPPPASTAEPVSPTAAAVVVDTTPSVTAPPAASAPTAIPVAVLPDPQPNPAQTATTSAPATPSEAIDSGPERLAVVLSVTEPSWVIVTADGKKIVNRLIQVGEQETLEALHDLVLTAGNAGAIVMTLNGRTARSIGPLGKTATTRIERTNVAKFVR